MLEAAAAGLRGSHGAAWPPPRSVGSLTYPRETRRRRADELIQKANVTLDTPEGTIEEVTVSFDDPGWLHVLKDGDVTTYPERKVSKVTWQRGTPMVH